MDVLETFSGTLAQTFIIPTMRRFSPQSMVNKFLIKLTPLVIISAKDLVNR